MEKQEEATVALCAKKKTTGRRTHHGRNRIGPREEDQAQSNTDNIERNIKQEIVNDPEFFADRVNFLRHK